MSRHKILVVDDEHLIRWSLEQNLKKQGYEVQTAPTGEDALRLLREDPPELVLLDVQLPGMNGLQVLEKIKEIDEEIIVIMVTALGVLETAVKAMRMGAHDYLNKPFNLDEMAIVNKKALEAGRHVWSEKPMGLTIQEARELMELANKKGVHIWPAPT